MTAAEVVGRSPVEEGRIAECYCSADRANIRGASGTKIGRHRSSDFIELVIDDGTVAQNYVSIVGRACVRGTRHTQDRNDACPC